MTTSLSLLAAMFRMATPLIFAAMGGLLSERAGVINIALEGLMLMGAFTGAAAAAMTHSPWMGALAGAAGGLGLAIIFGLCVIPLRANQVVTGMAINLLAYGLIPLATKAWFDSTSSTPALELSDRFVVAPVVMALASVLIVTLWLRHSKAGLWLQFAGENPEALSTAGIAVNPVRWGAVLTSGVLAGLGGMSLSVFLSSSYSREMTSGRGFMALAALIFGKWRPVPALLACLFFGLADALQIRLQGVVLWGNDPVPVQFIQVLPYAVTLIVLAGFIGKSRAPRALGTAWLGVIAMAIVFSGCDHRTPPVIAKAKPLMNNETPEMRLSRQNAERFHEVIKVLLDRQINDPKTFAAYVSSLDQGASLEGIINGLTHSSVYRELEKAGKPPPRSALPVFIKLFSDLQNGLHEKIPVNRLSGQPLPGIDFPKGDEPIITATGTPIIETDYAAIFGQSHLYTLKRFLTDAVIRTVDERLADPVQFAAWYGEFCEKTASKHVDFGLQLRNRSDRAFHRDWAMATLSHPEDTRRADKVLWETLNRALRILNYSATPPGGHP